MGRKKQYTTDVQIFFTPCPPERMPMLRNGINTLFDWLEELGEQQPAQPGQTISERICDELEPCHS